MKLCVSRSALLTTIVVIAAPAAAYAQTPPAQPPSVKVGVTIFADYTVTDSPKTTDATGETVTPNAFTVSRSYINVTGTVSRRVSFRITPDIVRASDSSLSGSQVFRLKYAYLDVNISGPTTVRFGMQQTPYLGAVDDVYRYRFQGTTFPERDGGLVSADLGVTVRSRIGGWGDIHAGFYNGEGYQRPEVNDQKAFMARFTVRPAASHAIAKGLRLTGFIQQDNYVQGAPRDRAVVSAWFEHARLNAGADWSRRTDQPTPASARTTGEGWSMFVTPFFKVKGNGPEALLRLDRFTPDSSRDARWTRVIAGAAYWFPREGSASAALLANLEQVNYTGIPKPTERRISLYALINF